MTNKEDIIKWVAALRSGKYKQIQGTLIHPKGWSHGVCALGVAQVENIPLNLDVMSFCHPAVPRGLNGIVWMNDHLQWPFEKIADEIAHKFLGEPRQLGLDGTIVQQTKGDPK